MSLKMPKWTLGHVDIFVYLYILYLYLPTSLENIAPMYTTGPSNCFQIARMKLSNNLNEATRIQLEGQVVYMGAVCFNDYY